MKITKLGHCCLLVEDQDLTILTDPGAFSTLQNEVKGIDIVLITHEHADHFHIESLKKVLENNANAKVVTNSSVGKLLEKENITFEVLEDGQGKKFGEVLVEGFGSLHAEIYPSITPVQNTSYLISEKLYFPGDAFFKPAKPVEVLALPVVGPWMHIKDCINFAFELSPKYVFPVHDGFLKFPGPFYAMPKSILEPKGIIFKTPEGQEPLEFN